MDRLFQSIKLEINDKIYLKDPQSSDLGKKIIEHSIVMIHELGFEDFTFKKLGAQIGSNESSIYRYFENKHKLLLYLTSWYWGWLEYQLVFSTNSIEDKKEKLRKAIEVITREVEVDSSFSYINEILLNKIIISEYSKSYLTKEVDKENKEGYFVIYKRMAQRLSDMIKGVDPEYLFPTSLASTVLEGSLHQYFLRDHFTSLTECTKSNSVTHYFTDMVFNSLKIEING
ncbi:TetR/AcrR family transcriptional regulator [Sediminicola sp. 1XM1-17]|uniref:TetR/AcrR family transcriptional regulator n=1 Tax=Sediminicola sp. 1XM1-17 TaxID=3127702 RepID=UPI00307726B3